MVKPTEKDKKSNGPSSAKATAGKAGHHYSAQDIQVLEGLEPVRKRPGMYIGTTGPDGLHHLVTEIFDNSRDEAMGGFANDVEIVLLPDNRVRVADNGRGIPVDTHKQTKVSALETIMTTLHAGGKFGGEGYKVSGGLHGVGASVVNALSVHMKVTVHRDGGVYTQEYTRGKKDATVKKVGKSDKQGTIVTFQPDEQIFKEIGFNFDRIVSHMREQAYLVKGLRISVIDARELQLEDGGTDSIFYFRELGLDAKSQSFCFEGGLLSLVKFYNQLWKPVHKKIFYIEKAGEGVESVEVALQYVDDISSRIMAFANNIANPEGGTHLTGFKTALTRTLNNYARKNNVVRESEENFTGDDVLEGLTAVISVKLREIQFEGQTKAKLGSVEAQGAVTAVFGDAFSGFLEENPEDARAIIGKALLALKARKAAKAAKDSVLRKGALEGMTLPGKLADCETKNASESELFIVEGDSAGGCFDGDTKVALVDGRNLSFKELIEEHKEGKQNFCYTIDSQDIKIAPIMHPRVTKQNAEVVKVILDNREEIICTPEHRFMIRDGSYKQAINLTEDDSLMPLVRKLSEIRGRITIKGYEMVLNPENSHWKFTHVLSDDYNLGRETYVKEKNTVIHHKDFNKLNNHPDNLVRMDHWAHFWYHTTCLEETIHRADVKEKCRKIRQTSEYREKISKVMLKPEVRELLSERAKKQWENPKYKKFMTAKFLEFYENNEQYREENNKRLNKEQKKYWSLGENKVKQSKRVTKFFEDHPEHKKFLKDLSETQWKDESLIRWRREETKKQWTPEFRAKRKIAYARTYLNKALASLYEIYKRKGAVDEVSYNELRREKNDKSLIRFETICNRFFEGNENAFKEAIMNFNHRIKKVEVLSKKIDVYDIEVPQTHNFALASGVFVHNSGKMGRDRRTQAVLPLKGKILNVERARLDKILGFAEIKSLVIALGTAIGDTFDVSKLRYHKIIIATDADTDGGHIRTLLLTLFYRYFKPLIEGGFIYIAQPPLYKIKRGKEVFYFFTEEEKSSFYEREGIEVKEEEETEGTDDREPSNGTEEMAEGEEDASAAKGKTQKIQVQRYKGLGEMNPEELWETTMDPEKRILKQVTIEDANEADKVFDILMGTDVPSRKSFIQSNATKATLDI
ncbi:MAG: ATP-binding protein [bacterium]|nr:ATP-binding protein [bacterium]